MTIATGSVVSMNYILTNAKGEEVDRSELGTPFEYLHGADQIVVGLETALVGLKVGDKKKVTVSPEQGYGEINPDLKAEVDKDSFPKDMDLIPGMQFRAQLENGPVVLRVESINGEMVTVNGNHPLAGETLHFDVEIVSVRKATAEEMAHGHAHGPDGHHH